MYHVVLWLRLFLNRVAQNPIPRFTITTVLRTFVADAASKAWDAYFLWAPGLSFKGPQKFTLVFIISILNIDAMVHSADAEIFYKEVNEHKGILVDEIERVFEQFKSEFEESKKFDETLMDEQSAGIEKRISDIKSFLEDTQANVKVCEDPCTLICYIQDTQEEYRRKIDSEIQRTKCSLPRYSPVPVEQSQIRDMCGNMKGGVRDVVHVERNEALSCSSFGADSVSLSSLPESDSVVVAEDWLIFWNFQMSSDFDFFCYRKDFILI